MTKEENSGNVITTMTGYYFRAKKDRHGHNLIRIFRAIKRGSRDKSRINVSLNSNDVTLHQAEAAAALPAFRFACVAFHFVAILNARFVA